MIDTYKIAVASASSGAGASLISSFLIKDLKNATLAELGHPYFYTALGMEKYFLHRVFVSYKSLLQEHKSVRDIKNVYDNINWLLLLPGESTPEPNELFRFINNAPGENILFDCSGLEENLLWNVLPEMDKVYIVIDPLPSKLIAAYPFLERVKLSLPNAVFVVNKMSNGVHKGELARFLGTKNYLEFPFLKPEIIYKAEYNSTLVSKLCDITLP